jgi:hypothetical protein
MNLAMIIGLLFAAILGISTLDDGGAWLCGPAIFALLVVLFRPWEWTIDMIKQSSKTFLILGSFSILLIIFIVTIFIAAVDLINEHYFDSLTTTSLCVMSYLGMIELTKSKFFKK